MKERQVFLFLIHVYSKDIIKEFKKIRSATKALGECVFLYQQKKDVPVNRQVLDLNPYIVTDADLKQLSDAPYFANTRVSRKPDRLLIKYYKEHKFDFYWLIEYDVRFSGNWEYFFRYFSETKDDFLSSHIRRYEQEPDWMHWSADHFDQKIELVKALRSFNPIIRISRPALAHVYDMYLKGWAGHYEALIPTILFHGNFSMRDFGGTGEFVLSQDINKFYLDSTNCELLDGQTMRCRPSYIFLYDCPKNKLIHPVKPRTKGSGGKFIPRILNTFKKLLASYRKIPLDTISDLISKDAYIPLLQVLPPKNVPVSLIAFYLPQFHEIPENNRWWGEGFTEWTNVISAKPQFKGHYQPRLPGELGYYHLLDGATQRRQIELAKLYGIGGFCFYTYWFSGQLLLEKPVENYLNDPGLDLPFCLCWANENWTRQWDGMKNDVLIAQEHTSQDDLAFIRYVSQYMRDERYIRIDGRPLLLVYRPSLLPSVKETVKRWREWCLQNDIGEIYLAYTQSFESVDPGEYGFDAAIEFPPNSSTPPNITDKVKLLKDRFCGTVYDWQYFVERARNYQKPEYKLFRGVCPSWDNTARRKNNSTIFLNSTLKGYQEWLGNAVVETCSRFSNPHERLVFINAWNEWAEGAHLEPDQKYGYAYLEATRRALLGKINESKTEKVIVVSHDAHPHGAQFLALSMVRALKHDLHFEVEVVLLGKGFFFKNFVALAPVYDLSDPEKRKATINNLANSFIQRGFTKAIVNTTVSGMIIPSFFESGIESICLVHEMPGVIQSFQLEEHAKQIARHAKAVVFAAQVVADGFSKFATVDSGKQFIRPQGLHRQNKWRSSKQLARSRLRNQLGLKPDSKIVITVGYADHRKGVDLFVECALRILAKRRDVDFIWVGHREEEMRKKIKAKLCNSPYKNRIHFVGYCPETALFYAASDVYALTSREDPFPSVVLESFDVAVPVVAFSNTGGAGPLINEVGGIVVPALDVAKFSDAICRLLDNPELSSKLGLAAQKQVNAHFAFPPYLIDLCRLLGIDLPKNSVVAPNYNYVQYVENG